MASITAVAAFVAAGLSLVNVLVSYFLSHRGQLNQWRRDAERPVVANVLALSGKLTSQLSDVAKARDEWLTSIQQDRNNENVAARDTAASEWRGARDTFEKLSFEITGLDLIAGRSPRDAAAELMSAQESLVHWLRPASGTSEPPQEIFSRQSGVAFNAERDLISAVRRDLGVDGAAGFARWVGTRG